MITMDDIVREGNPILRKVAKPVELPLTDEDKKTLVDMLEFIKTAKTLKSPKIRAPSGRRLSCATNRHF